MTTPIPQPQDLTAEEIRAHLEAGDEVWLWEGGRPKHKVYGVEGLTADHVTLGEDFKIVFKGAITGNVLGYQMNRSATVKAVTRRPPAESREPNGQHAEGSNGQVQHP
jgi:hypothetical protein